MKEIPFIQHHPLLPLPSSSPSGGGGGAGGSTGGAGNSKSRVIVASVDLNSIGGDGAIAVLLSENASNNVGNHYAASSTALVPVEDNSSFPSSQQTNQNSANIDSTHETHDMFGLSSLHHCAIDNRIICTTGVPGRRGLVRISIRNGPADLADDGSTSDVLAGEDGDLPSDVQVDISSLMSTKLSGSAYLFEGPIVGTSIFVTTPPDEEEGNDVGGVGEVDMSSASNKSILHLRMVDPYGTILSVSFSYPNMQPIPSSSFILPLSSKVRPHPGSAIECNQVCFPTPSSVVFALNPHLYCVDLGACVNNGGVNEEGQDPSEGGEGAGQVAVTRVWTNIHHVTSDPIADNSNNSGDATSKGLATPTPRKKQKSTGGLGSILSKATYLMGMSGYNASEEYEYPSEEEEEEYGSGGGMIPSIAALASLSNDSGEHDNVASVSTLHSDGSLRIWTAELSRHSSKEGQLRIPSVQRLAVTQSTSWTSSNVYTNPDIPLPSTWDPCRDALTLRGQYTRDDNGICEYEVALHVQCYDHLSSTNDSKNKEGMVFIFQGAIVSPANGNDEISSLPSGDTANVQTLTLPKGAVSVVDISWSSTRDLMVLLRHREVNEEETETFYDIGQEVESAKVMLALYPLDSTGKYATEGVLPSNMTLPYMDMNHFGYVFGLSVEEELDRYMTYSSVAGANGDGEDDEEETQVIDGSSAETVAKAEAEVDKAGLLTLLQPFGRSRPSAVAVHRALSSLDLLDGNVGIDEVRPVMILSSMRKWKKRSVLSSSSTALVAVGGDGNNGTDSPMASTGNLSIYHAFASATKQGSRSSTATSRLGEDNAEAKSGVNAVEAARQAHKLKWIRLLSEVRKQDARLNEVQSLTMSASTNFLVRGSQLSILTLEDELDTAPTSTGQAGEVTAGLDELSMDLMACIASNPDLREILTKVESLLYDCASKASSLVNSWSSNGLDVELLAQLELLGNSAMMRLSLTDLPMELLGALAQPTPNVVEEWLGSLFSASPSVSKRLAITKPFATMPNSDSNTGGQVSSEASVPAASLISSQLESIRQLSLARLILVFGSPEKNPLAIQHEALRSTLYCTALSWAVHQSSSTNKSMTVLEEHLSQEVTKDFFRSGMAPASPLAEMFIASAVSYYVNESPGDVLSLLTSPSYEPRVALRVLAPLVELSSQSDQKRKEVVAECLLAEAAVLAKVDARSASETSPESLWRLASKLLLDDISNRAETLERHLGSMDGSPIFLPLCCSLVLEAVQDAISLHGAVDPSLSEIAFHTSLRGQLWDEALRACISNPSTNQGKANLKRLILGMVDAGALGKLVYMSLTVVGRELSGSFQEVGQESDAEPNGVDLFELASSIIEEAAIEQAHTPLGSEAEGALQDRPNYWGCLYALHASRGNWKQAAEALDMCGKATADSVSKSNRVFSKAASRKIMDDACLSAQACLHSISMIDEPSQRYLLPGGNPSSLLTESDLERRAKRALALQTLSKDEYSPAVDSLLKSSSHDTIDTLARFGYFDQAISVASGVSSKRNGQPDVFTGAMQYILCTYLVPAATKPASAASDPLQSRSKIAQIKSSSSTCALGSTVKTSVTSSSVNAKSWVPNDQSEKVLQSTMAMDLLQQYTTTYSKRCIGLGLRVANAILQSGIEIPIWLRDLCMFGIPGDNEKTTGLFANSAGKGSGIADPAGLMRVYIKHHHYGEACDVVTSVLSKQTVQPSQSTNRLPEKGSVDYVPYDLIDMLWNMIDSIIESNSSNTSEDAKSQVQSLTKRRTGMEQALEKYFESLKISEEGLASSRALCT